MGARPTEMAVAIRRLLRDLDPRVLPPGGLVEPRRRRLPAHELWPDFVRGMQIVGARGVVED
jgi:hypothetical protein